MQIHMVGYGDSNIILIILSLFLKDPRRLRYQKITNLFLQEHLKSSHKKITDICTMTGQET